MNIKNIGWNNFFSSQISNIEKDQFIPARVYTRHGKHYFLLCEYGEIEARMTGRFLHNAIENKELPVVGDWVLVNFIEDEKKGVINRILDRKTIFSRKYKGTRDDEHIISSNIDVIFYVAGLDNDYNPRKIERFLTLANNGGAKPIIILNKKDLCTNIHAVSEEVSNLIQNNDFFIISAINEMDFDFIKKSIPSGHTAAFIGSSGTGKSTIINKLLGFDKQKTAETRNDSKGRHTTTNRELIITSWGGMIIDTPGMRELQLWADENDLDSAFFDIKKLSENCRFRDCTHTNEPGCNVKKSVDNGIISNERLDSYLKLKQEFKDLVLNQQM
ncbi:MAG: ribosome small subunit-dependent GTPase A, partial [Candidatus Muirbacterium halophilum]|nr:ribosome small subunit-dependent GTPase A [Candidatus Muirbacterium halophilum]